MAEGRILKAREARDRRVNSMSPWAIIGWHRLNVQADDDGRFSAEPEDLRHALYYRNREIGIDEVTAIIGEWSRAGLVAVYEHRGELVLQCLAFRLEQSIRADRYRASDYPPPPGYRFEPDTESRSWKAGGWVPDLEEPVQLAMCGHSDGQLPVTAPSGCGHVDGQVPDTLRSDRPHKVEAELKVEAEWKVEAAREASTIWDQVQTFMGARTLSARDAETVRSWLDAGYPDDLVAEALKAATARGGRTPRYADTILADWSGSGILTAEAARALPAGKGRAAVRDAALAETFASRGGRPT